MIAPLGELLRALGVLEARGQAFVSRQHYTVDDHHIDYVSSEDAHMCEFRNRQYHMSLDVILTGPLNVRYSLEEALLAAARAVLPKGDTLTADELYENAANWFAERMHRPNRKEAM